ncbi:hypothetical protein A2121_00715 [Candidatus Nomurabacteria bacterium GWB1_40_6]|uniref:Uncharacterized protein n=1 Tax=Candidatus Nomurabacteria bacterium GWB1_40_6 TaxID=1801727 RepID=A0A1F6TL72_9BACT|nr:MAG: hypothetical protein A2121_00715 [Candidatus Nomurabacteria bacterium GWB1_40_6]
MENTTDLLQIKIEKAKAQLPENTLNAINAVPWQAIILQMRETKGYSFEQLGELETETELLLCDLLNPENYQKELKDRMKLSDSQVNELVNEMNKLVFVKIKEELIRGTGNKKVSTNETKNAQNIPIKTALSDKEQERDTQILKSAGIEIIPDLPAAPSAQLMQAGKLEISSPLEEYSTHKVEGGGNASTPAKATPQEGNIHPILTQKLSGFVKNSVVETDHSLHNISPKESENTPGGNVKKIDPYREIPE